MDAQQPTQTNTQPMAQATGAGEQKDFVTTLLLAIFLGGFGVHRFYTGHTGIGIAQLLTLGGCGLWSLYDIIMIATGSFKDANGMTLKR